jgi:outer membrane protein OmpA-like peptidoglycan-associated protein
MKQQYSLDHDGLDGILQSSPKPKSKYFYSRLLWLVPILIITASTAFWLQKDRQTYPLQPSARLENLPQLSDQTTVVENKSPTSSVSTQSVQPSISSQPGNVSLPSKNPAEPTLSDSIHSIRSTTALENQIAHARESAEVETAASIKPTVIKPVSEVAAQKDKDQTAKSLIDENIKINFKFASSKVNLSKSQKTDLTRLLKKCDNKIEITGYTCSQGSSDRNLRLGFARAHALKRLLINTGVPAERIITASKGMQSPTASNETVSGRALNRRAELSCKGKTQ